MAENKYDGLEIAIIGISGQFPGSKDYREFWQNLKVGNDLITTFTDEELRKTGVPNTSLNNNLYVKSMGVLSEKGRFDHAFFGYSVEEAAFMDPQIRLFHEFCWMALEDSGYSAWIEKKKIGLFAGASSNENWKVHTYKMSSNSSIDTFYLNMISAQNFISSLTSYKLNLTGPACYIDTACSSSLVAVHLACRSLLTRESAIALAGGISIKTQKQKGYFYQEGMVRSSDGYCRAFDARASGTASGEGAGVVVLKRLNDALSNGDHIYAIIKGSAINNDGNRKVGFTAPSVTGQAECITTAQKFAKVLPESIGYIEAHGTGTKLGDPIEIRALNKAFGVGGANKFCAIGSVKTNMGHLDAAAGVAGLIKAALCLKHRQIPASLHYTQPNPEIDFDKGPFYVNTHLKEWCRNGSHPLRAGVSSFGIGGTNAHVILEEAPDRLEGSPEGVYKVLTLSAKTPSSLCRYMSNLRDFLLEEPNINMADMAYTFQVGRKPFLYRNSIVYQHRQELIYLLESGNAEKMFTKSKDRAPGIVFMFPGQGSQYVDMCKGLYFGLPSFKKDMDYGFTLLESLTGKRFQDILYSSVVNTEDLNHTNNTQPLVFLLEYSLSRFMISLDIAPRYMIGHSLGEYVAACLNGVFSFEDALRLVVKRGELMNRLAPGMMLSVAISESEAESYISSTVSLAAVNSPEQVVFSGDTASITGLIHQLDKLNITYVQLHTSHAFHSEMQSPIMEEFRKELQKITFNDFQPSYISNVTGDVIHKQEASSCDYWVRHLRETVRFSDGINTLLSKQEDLVYIEVGGGYSLTKLLRQSQSKANKISTVNLVRPFKEEKDDLQYLTSCIGQMWSLGINIDWNVYYQGESRQRISLPTYSFEATPYTSEVNPFNELSVAGILGESIGQARELKDYIYYPSWKRILQSGLEKSKIAPCYLFFLPESGLLNSMEFDTLLKGELIKVFIGKEFKKISNIHYIVNPSNAEGFSLLFKSLSEDGIKFTDIMYAWNMEADVLKLQLKPENEELHKVYFSIVKIIQTLIKNNQLHELRVIIITNTLHKVIGYEKVSYIQSFILGLVNVLPQEYGISCCNIDVDLSEEGVGVQSLINEIKNYDSLNRIVALRHGYRWMPDYEKNTSSCSIQKTLIKSGGTYLITGGLGNLGCVLATHLIKKYGAKIILTGRKAINQGESDRLVNMQRLSKDIFYYKSDISDSAAFSNTVEEIENSLGTIDGVIHLAGVLTPSYFELIEEISLEKAIGMFAPKVNGIKSIYTVFKDRRPDFVWIASSIATVLGGLGYSSYSSANLYMNHFIESKSDELSNWKCIGLAEMAFGAQQDEKALNPQQIAELFEWTLSIEGTAVIQETVEDLGNRLDKAYSHNIGQKLDNIEEGKSNNKADRPELTTKYHPPITQTEKKLTALLEDFFSIQQIGIEDNFFELGGDSLKAMVLLKKIKAAFDINLTLKDFFGSENIKDLASEIDKKLWISNHLSEANKQINQDNISQIENSDHFII